MKTGHAPHLRRIFLISGIITAGVLVACFGDDISSIHFHGSGFGDKKKYDFGRVPQEVRIAGWTNEPSRGGTDNETGIPAFENFNGDALADNIRKSDEDYWYRSDDKKRDVFQNLQVALHKARNLEIRGKFSEAATAFRVASQAKRIVSFGKDRTELNELGLNQKTKGYAEYLRERYLLEFGYEKQQALALDALKKLDADPRIQPHIQYAIAACAEPKTPRKQRSDAFLEIASKYPTSKRAEAALVMAARANVELNDWYRADDEDWKAGMAIFDQLVTKFPHSRFLDNVEGWRGAYELHRKDTIAAISHYLKQAKSTDPRECWKGHQALSEIAESEGRLTDATVHWLIQRSLPLSSHFKVSSSRQIRQAFNGFNQKDAQIIQAKIKKSPELLSAYLDFRMEDTWLSPEQERQLLKYVTTNISRAKSVDRGVYGRLAQLQYSAGNYAQSLRLSRLAKSAIGDVGDRARFIEASSLDRFGQHKEAIRLYEALYQRPTRDYLHQSCAEQIAFLNEKVGNPVRAYVMYRELGYNEDLAFLIDSELSPGQISQVIRQAKTHKERSALKYSLAMRYFRKGDYGLARQVLERLPKEVRMDYASEIANYMTRYGAEEKKVAPIDALTDVVTMQRLRRQAESAPNQEARGKAIYAMAQYTHKRRNLMFYSVALWQGSRSTMYPIFWNDVINKGKFAKIAHDSAYEHECDAQTLKFCREVVRRCPNSSVVPDALYTAGVSAESLSRFNGYWEGFNDHLLLQASRFMKRVAREYPHHALAKSARKYGEEFAEDQKPRY